MISNIRYTSLIANITHIRCTNITFLSLIFTEDSLIKTCFICRSLLAEALKSVLLKSKVLVGPGIANRRSNDTSQLTNVSSSPSPGFFGSRCAVARLNPRCNQHHQHHHHHQTYSPLRTSQFLTHRSFTTPSSSSLCLSS